MNLKSEIKNPESRWEREKGTQPVMQFVSRYFGTDQSENQNLELLAWQIVPNQK